MKKKGSILFVSIILLLVVVIGVIAIFVYKSPLGPALQLEAIDSNPRPVFTSTSINNLGVNTSVAPTTDLMVEIPTLLPTNVPTALPIPSTNTCGLAGRMSMLVIGQATVENGNHVGAGAIRLMVIDFDHSTVSVLSLPSDLWVDAKALKDPNIPFTTLDLIYYDIYTKNSTQAEDVSHIKSTEILAQSIFDNFGFLPDHYLTILQKPFIRMVDLLGGIDLNLATEIVPSVPSFGIYPAGLQHLDGQQTLNFTRLHPKSFQGDDTWGEFERQNLVLKALLKTALQPENWTKAPSLIEQARKTALTDLSVEQIYALKCMMEQAGNQVKMLQVEERMITTDVQGHWQPDSRAIKAQISQMYGP